MSVGFLNVLYVILTTTVCSQHHYPCLMMGKLRRREDTDLPKAELRFEHPPPKLGPRPSCMLGTSRVSGRPRGPLAHSLPQLGPLMVAAPSFGFRTWVVPPSSLHSWVRCWGREAGGHVSVPGWRVKLNNQQAGRRRLRAESGSHALVGAPLAARPVVSLVCVLGADVFGSGRG